MRILIVEDDTDLSARLSERLVSENYVVDCCEDGEVGLYMAETGTYAAVILDIGLPVLDGLTLLERFRERQGTAPVILLTARDSWRDKVKGLRLGADDYLAKPFETEELLARLEALIRRAHGASDPKLMIGDLTVDLSAHEVALGGKSLRLTAGEYRVLAYLAVNRGHVVTKTDLAAQIWYEETQKELNAVEVVVGRLRKKVGADIIETRRGLGYVIPS
ncbi:MAG: response regulator transcription factor [Pseudomonadota bacterium]